LGFTRDFPLELDIGRMDIEYRHCGALHFQRERTGKDLDQFMSCCYKGTVVLLSLLPFPDELKLLFLRNHSLSKLFHKHIRKYNGQIYHFLGPAQPNTNEVPTFEQLYFMETADAQIHRNNNSINANLNTNLLSFLDEQEEHNIAINQGCQPMEIQIVFENDYCLDQCRYNAPHINEVAALNADCDPMSYPVLFPEVDAYVKVDATRLNYQQQNQKTLRAETYCGLADYLFVAAEEKMLPDIVGKVFKLKLYMLMEDLLKNEILEKVVAYTRGYDCAKLQLKNIEGSNVQVLNYDEILTFIDSQYVSASEAFWRLSKYKMQEKSHTVIQLPVRLPENQTVYFNNENEAEALDSLQAQNTILTTWFELNKQNTDARKIIYHNIPLFYTFDTKTRLWKK
ncbi:7503_t:CDS:2, partial [Dentiscutata erythropus]